MKAMPGIKRSAWVTYSDAYQVDVDNDNDPSLLATARWFGHTTYLIDALGHTTGILAATTANETPVPQPFTILPAVNANQASIATSSSTSLATAAASIPTSPPSFSRSNAMMAAIGAGAGLGALLTLAIFYSYRQRFVKRRRQRFEAPLHPPSSSASHVFPSQSVPFVRAGILPAASTFPNTDEKAPAWTDGLDLPPLSAPSKYYVSDAPTSTLATEDGEGYAASLPGRDGHEGRHVRSEGDREKRLKRLQPMGDGALTAHAEKVAEDLPMEPNVPKHRELELPRSILKRPAGLDDAIALQWREKDKHLRMTVRGLMYSDKKREAYRPRWADENESGQDSARVKAATKVAPATRRERKGVTFGEDMVRVLSTTDDESDVEEDDDWQTIDSKVEVEQAHETDAQ